MEVAVRVQPNSPYGEVMVGVGPRLATRRVPDDYRIQTFLDALGEALRGEAEDRPAAGAEVELRVRALLRYVAG